MGDYQLKIDKFVVIEPRDTSAVIQLTQLTVIYVIYAPPFSSGPHGLTESMGHCQAEQFRHQGMFAAVWVILKAWARFPRPGHAGKVHREPSYLGLGQA